MSTLKDRSVLITGGGRGIGRCIALACAKEGANVTVAARTRSKIDAVARETGGRAVELDVCDEGSITRAVKETGRIDVLINNAAAFGGGHVAELDVDVWDRVLNTNLRGVFLMTRAVLPQMIERRGGDIVMISSTSGKRGNPGSTAYTAAKHGLNGFTHALLGEVRRHNIRVLTISPSAVDNPEREKGMRENRLQAPEVAETVVAALKLPARALIRDVELWATNPW